MNGSHAIVSWLPTWPAIQAAACDRTVPTPPEDLADPLRGNWLWFALPDAGTRAAREDVPVNRTTTTAAAPMASTQIAMSNACRERRRRCSRRAAHNLMVVARTGPQDGTPGGVSGAADLAVSSACCFGEPVNCMPITR